MKKNLKKERKRTRKKKKRKKGTKNTKTKGRKKLGTDSPYYPIWPVACPPNKMKKSASSSHHVRTVVLPTVYGGLLWVAVKGFYHGDRPLFPIFMFYLNTLSLYLPLSLSKASIVKPSFSP